MKKSALIALFAAALLTLAGGAHADRYQRHTSDNPIRLVRYAVHPVGLLVEYVVYRPIHWVVSRPNLDIVFGHHATRHDDGTYFEWTHGDFKPSVTAESTPAAASSAPK